MPSRCFFSRLENVFFAKMESSTKSICLLFVNSICLHIQCWHEKGEKRNKNDDVKNKQRKTLLKKIIIKANNETRRNTWSRKEASKQTNRKKKKTESKLPKCHTVRYLKALWQRLSHKITSQHLREYTAWRVSMQWQFEKKNKTKIEIRDRFGLIRLWASARATMINTFNKFELSVRSRKKNIEHDPLEHTLDTHTFFVVKAAECAHALNPKQPIHKQNSMNHIF